MTPLFSTIANGTVQIWEAVLLMATAAVRVAPPRQTRRDVSLDAHTLRDIGVEPGSITWL